MDNKFYEAVCFLDREIKNVLLKIEKNIAENVSEIRLRCERPVALTLFDGRSVYLKENGTVVFIDRPLEKLVTTADRPLSSSRELLEKRYKERYGLYCAAADIKIDAVDEIGQNVKNIEEVFLNENTCN